jgi:glycosyltransferase involved in cell wall biosynthesis
MTICVVLKGYPRLSETFIAQEILALQKRGVALNIASLRHPTDSQTHPVHRDIDAAVNYLPEYLHDEPGRVFKAWARVRSRDGYTAARAAFHGDLMRDPTRNRFRRFGQACVLADELPPGTSRFYAHFLHTPASVARYAALITGLPWCCSAHAKDIWTTPQWEIGEKLAALDWLVTCTAFGADYLSQFAPRPDTVSLLYHGLDFTRFPPPPPIERSGDRPIRILSVGRAVAKKGYDDLLQALALLPQDLDWEFCHIGGGPLLEELRAQADRLELTARIEWLGPQPQEAILDALRDADIFTLASKIAEDGDRDGLPNVLMEAQSQALAVAATKTAGIPELIDDGETGLLAPPNDPAGLAAAITRLIGDPKLRQRLGEAGFERVRSVFSLDSGIDRLAARLGGTEHPVAA